MRVLVTGSSSHLAAALLPCLCAHADVEQVTGIDLKPPHFQHAKFHPRQLDVRHPALEHLLHSHDALVHLAFVVLRGRMDEREMYDINVAGSRKVFHAARRAGVRRLVHMSSAAVYGGGVDLREEAAFDPIPGFLYATHKARVEEMLAAEFPECVRLRPHAILGRHAQPLLKQLLDQPCYLRMPEPYPRLQCVHEDDVAQAVVLALMSDVIGPFNLAVPDNVSFRDVIRRRHPISVALPRIAAQAGLNLAWRLFGWGGEPAWIEGLARTLLIDCSRAAGELGWRSTHDAASALASVSRAGDGRAV
ncbi:MAG: NAD-dependent epimerase/dehydratase family protein [Betaproteobacteria bacterium]|nr:NAD-dependent epimerase/dehydratase family protein [Betaproteobacteria bacterium]